MSPPLSGDRRPVPQEKPVAVYDRVREPRILWRDPAGVERGVGAFSCSDGGIRPSDPHRTCGIEPATGPDADWGLIAVLDGKNDNGSPLVGGANVRTTALIVPTRRHALVIEFCRGRETFCAAYPVCLSRFRAALRAFSDVTSVTDWGKAKGLLLYSLGRRTPADIRAKVARYRATRVYAIAKAQRAIDRLMRHVVAERATAPDLCPGCVANLAARYDISAQVAASGVGASHCDDGQIEKLALAWWLSFEVYYRGQAKTGPFSRRQNGRFIDPSLELEDGD